MEKSAYRVTGKPDLEDRTFRFAQAAVDFIESLPRTLANREISKQLVRSAGSIGANYIEANESLGEKDFVMRLRICRKEAKETVYWLRLLRVQNAIISQKHEALLQEATELTRIFGSIVTKVEHKASQY
jgi:four helix bundle protein